MLYRFLPDKAIDLMDEAGSRVREDYSEFNCRSLAESQLHRLVGLRVPDASAAVVVNQPFLEALSSTLPLLLIFFWILWFNV